MRQQRVAAGALGALVEALSVIYWYKDDLARFLRRSLSRYPELLAPLPYEGTKRDVAQALVSLLADREEDYQEVLVNLMVEVSRFRDFSHLKRVDDGEQKVVVAHQAVEALAGWLESHEQLVDEAEKGEEQRSRSRQEAIERQTLAAKLEGLRAGYLDLCATANPQKRGLQLEPFLYELFRLFDLDPRAPFRLKAEQIDGALTFEGDDYLLEARWQNQPTTKRDLDSFSAIVERKLKTTLGIFVSINGFQASAVAQYSNNHPSLVLVDGADLLAVLERRIPLPELLRRKRRHAAETGEAYLPIHRLLA